MNSGLDANLVFWCSSSYLETKLNESFIAVHAIQRWSAHFLLYMKFIRSRLLAEGNPLTRGKVWKNMEAVPLTQRPRHNLKSTHIHALKAMLVDCQILELEETLPHNVKQYLENLASMGQDIANYVGVQPVVLHATLQASIPRKEKIKNAIQALENLDFQAFEEYKGAAKYNQLPFEQAFTKATPDDLWAVILGETARTDNDKISHFFATTDFTQDMQRRFTIDTLSEWHSLYLRAIPDKLTSEQRSRYGKNSRVISISPEDGEELKGLWRLWFESWQTRFVTNSLVKNASKLARTAQEQSRVQGRSRTTRESRFAHVLLSLTVEGGSFAGRPISEGGNYKQSVRPPLQLA